MDSKNSFGNGHSIIPHLSNKVRDFFANFRPLQENRVMSSESPTPQSKRSVSIAELDLEKQLSAWKENPAWAENSPVVEVTVPKGTLCNLNVTVDVGLPPDAVYNIVTDPDNKRVFKNIKEVISRKVLVDEGHRQIVEVDQAAIWRFLWWSGTISVHVLVDQNRQDYTMKFKQVKSGFMKRFEGSWKLEPLFVDEHLCGNLKPESLKDYETCTRGKGRVASRLYLEQLIQPSIVPPPPISWYVRGITTKTTEMLINDLLAEAARIRQHSDITAKDSVEGGGDVIDDDIKERWAIARRRRRRRRRAEKPQRRLSLDSKSDHR